MGMCFLIMGIVYKQKYLLCMNMSVVLWKSGFSKTLVKIRQGHNKILVIKTSISMSNKKQRYL
jgi:hypothetical protein